MQMQMQAAAAGFFNPVKKRPGGCGKGVSESAKRVQIGRSNAGAWRGVLLPFHSLGRPVGSPVFRGCVYPRPSSASPSNRKKEGVSCLIPTRPDPTDPGQAGQ